MAKKKTTKKVAKKKTASKVAKKKTATKASKKTAKKTAKKKTAAKVSKKTSKSSATKKKVAKKVTKAPAKKAAKKVAKKTKKVAAKKVTKASTKKTVAKKATKAAPKKTAKKAPAKSTTKKQEAPSPKKAKVEAAPKKGKKGVKASKEEVSAKAQSATELNGDNLAKDAKKSRMEDEVLIDDEELALSVKEEDQIRDHLADEFTSLSEDFSLKDIFEAVRLLDFFQVETDECIERNCDNPATTLGYCRYHYIKNWKDIKKKQSILMEGKLQDYIEDLVGKYPPKYIEAIITDLSEDKAFMGVLKELNIESEDEESFDEDGDDDQDIAYETKGTVKTSFIDD